MDDAKGFLVLRYSLIEDSQTSLNASPLPKIKGQAILPAILGDKEFEIKGIRYSFVGFRPAVPADSKDFPADTYYVGKTAKLRKTHVGEKVPGDIVEHRADDWIPLVTVFDVSEQYIFVEKDWNFGTETQTARAIEAGLRPIVLANCNHLVFVEPKTKKEQFWKLIEKSKKIYKIQLELISPNILETNLKAREALSALESLFNQKEIKITLENEAGELAAPKEPLTDYVDYIAEGEGSWRVTTEGAKGGKKSHSSREQAEIVDLPVANSDSEIGVQLNFGDITKSNHFGFSERIAAAAFTHVARGLRRKKDG